MTEVNSDQAATLIHYAVQAADGEAQLNPPPDGETPATTPAASSPPPSSTSSSRGCWSSPPTLSAASPSPSLPTGRAPGGWSGPVGRGALGGTRTPNLLIRRCPYRRPDPFRSVRDLGFVSAGCPGEYGEPVSRSSVWLPAWLPWRRWRELPLPPPLLCGLAGDAKAGADLGPGVAASAQALDRLGGGSVQFVGEPGHQDERFDVAVCDAAAVGAQDAADERCVFVVLDMPSRSFGVNLALTADRLAESAAVDGWAGVMTGLTGRPRRPAARSAADDR